METPATDLATDLLRARDPEAMPSDLLPLAAHRESSVRAIVASRADCPVAALTSLGHDRHPDVLRALLANPRTPSSVVRRLADHRDAAISELAVQRLRNSFR
ncbi:hypothetical protein [Demequina lignilytica]|uniref:Leucine rich repeat variant n=1 Tax=Demequina lignilytica TaxID=3051663 RepID=A0AAW7M995_9MICO|nr:MULTISPECIES: hypothetical protein [unclassified Demequina]MDN4478130.1 hypothetical protein [Demequina sp. SYSU T00039-1]MDN4482791.1 hypothetical protein [Demequina sp. SYSU T0a273]MDN4488420.1 hypothetical protein [Demequina sp. SYSU T00039]MDN4490033.1 hypothetical protein [Demequina sp. SYSU T00068]